MDSAEKKKLPDNFWSDLMKVWSPIIFGVIMFYVSFVKLQDTVDRLDKVVENLATITNEVNISVQIHEEKIKSLDNRMTKLENKIN